jgi:ribosomal protein L29
MKHFSNELKQTHLLKLHRRAIARLQTLIKESEQKI